MAVCQAWEANLSQKPSPPSYRSHNSAMPFSYHGITEPEYTPPIKAQSGFQYERHNPNKRTCVRLSIGIGLKHHEAGWRSGEQ